MRRCSKGTKKPRCAWVTSLQVVPMTLTRCGTCVSFRGSAISRLVLEITRAGLSPFSGRSWCSSIMVWAAIEAGNGVVKRGQGRPRRSADRGCRLASDRIAAGLPGRDSGPGSTSSLGQDVEQQKQRMHSHEPSSLGALFSSGRLEALAVRRRLIGFAARVRSASYCAYNPSEVGDEILQPPACAAGGVIRLVPFL